MSKWRISLCTAAFVFAALPVADAADPKALPTIDLQVRCKRSEATMIAMMGDQTLKGSAFDLCMKSEQQARDALQAAWAEIPPSYKSFCVRPTVYSASYVEWIACVEMLIDVKKLRTGTGSNVTDAPKICPVITYADDGSIKSVVACGQVGRR